VAGSLAFHVVLEISLADRLFRDSDLWD